MRAQSTQMSPAPYSRACAHVDDGGQDAEGHLLRHSCQRGHIQDAAAARRYPASHARLLTTVALRQ